MCPDDMEYCDCYNAGKEISSLPCGGCKFCKRAQEQWSSFEEDVDDVVPLAVRQVGPSGNAVLKDGGSPSEMDRRRYRTISAYTFPLGAGSKTLLGQ